MSAHASGERGEQGGEMKRLSILLGLVFALTATAPAAELRVVAGSGVAGPLKELAATFEKATGHKVSFRFGTTPEQAKLVTDGGPFDIAVVTQDVFKNPDARAKFAPGATPAFAKVGLGVAVPKGAPKPDISTPEALKRTLLAAKSISSIPASAAGNALSRLYEGLGIAEEMKARIKAQAGPKQVVDAVAGGEAEMAVFLLNVLRDERLDIVGPLPPSLQFEVIFSIAVAADSKEPDAARALIAHLVSPAAPSIIKSWSLTPG
jgi:molybdate transport system substrate-binding protein